MFWCTFIVNSTVSRELVVLLVDDKYCFSILLMMLVPLVAN